MGQAIRALGVLAALAMLGAGPGRAQDGEEPPPSLPPVYVPPVVPVVPDLFNDPVFTPDLSPPQPAAIAGVVATPADTARIVARVAQAFEFCTALVQREYVVDCLSERIETLAASLPATGDYAEMRGALAGAAERLDAIVERAPSPNLPTGVATSTGPVPEATTRPIRPVATEAADAAIAEAAQVIEETQTVLLRSAQGSADRSLAYQQVSAALGTGTVLLRSA